MGIAAALVVLMTGFAVTMAVQTGRIARERDRANDETHRANQEAQAAQDVTSSSSGRSTRRIRASLGARRSLQSRCWIWVRRESKRVKSSEHRSSPFHVSHSAESWFSSAGVRKLNQCSMVRCKLCGNLGLGTRSHRDRPEAPCRAAQMPWGLPEGPTARHPRQRDPSGGGGSQDALRDGSTPTGIGRARDWATFRDG